MYWERDINGIITTIGPSTNPNKYGGSTTVNPSLTINNVDFSDEGNYRCYATNIVGTGSSNQGFLDVSGREFKAFKKKKKKKDFNFMNFSFSKDLGHLHLKIPII